ncbi:aminotransferase class V-fold PLP-dependent enzyme [Ketogulonicigenium vulgare]|uniref:DNA-binding transcriptional activator 3HPP-binding protein n=1 Tax=Ketogulonicigenium vulgare (strain WSH-001) TaxID=759362 RepID=F9Y8Y5_KETVW|nr:aminotransferase class V-fold PLP-dependent enzyme [Ketogulonicigenium vulgare]ADO41812.1 DNA-binding protein transcriptional activator, 3HPP-binding protein [Ketogulonicigenium vulgare Y25]AEM40041.1 DNA-binding transcriptional activator 3HPP-binding protein [Ketogulonicigenium vulgare WSH-001]ALJ80247.1 transcriptional regulator [Ketogulonicigenium vulgare]ANW33106.1 transcriptional regulator [Ketogulonicigenium vulgare]AOZ53741.1 DNA-binding protein transcriptional activator, 3HPP-bindin
MFPIAKSHFPALEDDVAHFAAGGQTPLPAAAMTAINDFARRKGAGQAGYNAHQALVNETRQRTARILGVSADDIAFLGSASDAISRVIQAIDWRAGDNAVMPALDYASGRAALQQLAPLGVSLRQVEAAGWICDEADLIAACDARTRLVYVSQINPRTGQAMDIARIHAALSPRGIIVLNDATHALCAQSVDGTAADITVSSCYKFVMASFMGVLCTGTPNGRALMPKGAGWHAMGETGPKRWEYGNVPHLDVAILHGSLGWQEGLGDMAARGDYLLAVADQIGALVTGAGYPIVPRDGGRASQNICVIGGGDIAALGAHLETQRIRIWYDLGRLRLSAQIFNDAADLDRLACALA